MEPDLATPRYLRRYPVARCEAAKRANRFHPGERTARFRWRTWENRVLQRRHARRRSLPPRRYRSARSRRCEDRHLSERTAFRADDATEFVRDTHYSPTGRHYACGDDQPNRIARQFFQWWRMDHDATAGCDQCPR